jgi:molecular chaperone DnaK (HSP70)
VTNLESQPDSSTQLDSDTKNFEERRSRYIDQFVKVCNEDNPHAAISIVSGEKPLDGHIVYVHGDHYQAAKLLAMVLRKIKSQIAIELDA